MKTLKVRMKDGAVAQGVEHLPSLYDLFHWEEGKGKRGTGAVNMSETLKH